MWRAIDLVSAAVDITGQGAVVAAVVAVVVFVAVVVAVEVGQGMSCGVVIGVVERETPNLADAGLVGVEGLLFAASGLDRDAWPRGVRK